MSNKKGHMKLLLLLGFMLFLSSCNIFDSTLPNDPPEKVCAHEPYEVKVYAHESYEVSNEIKVIKVCTEYRYE